MNSSSSSVQTLCLFCTDAAASKCHRCGNRTCAAHAEVWIVGEDNAEQVWCAECLDICMQCDNEATDVCGNCPARLCAACAVKCSELHRCDKTKYCADCVKTTLYPCANCKRHYCQMYVADCCDNAITRQLCARCIRNEVLSCDEVDCCKTGCQSCMVQVCRMCCSYRCKQCSVQANRGVGFYVPHACQMRQCEQPVCLRCAGQCTRCKKYYCADHGTFKCNAKCTQELCHECSPRMPCSPCKKRAPEPVQSDLPVMAK